MRSAFLRFVMLTAAVCALAFYLIQSEVFASLPPAAPVALASKTLVWRDEARQADHMVFGGQRLRRPATPREWLQRSAAGRLDVNDALWMK